MERMKVPISEESLSSIDVMSYALAIYQPVCIPIWLRHSIISHLPISLPPSHSLSLSSSLTLASALSALTTFLTLLSCSGVTRSHLLITITLANSTLASKRECEEERITKYKRWSDEMCEYLYVSVWGREREERREREGGKGGERKWKIDCECECII